MKASGALAIHRSALRRLLHRHGFLNLRVFGSVLTKADTEESDLDRHVSGIPAWHDPVGIALLLMQCIIDLIAPRPSEHSMISLPARGEGGPECPVFQVSTSAGTWLAGTCAPREPTDEEMWCSARAVFRVQPRGERQRGRR